MFLEFFSAGVISDDELTFGYLIANWSVGKPFNASAKGHHVFSLGNIACDFS